VGTLVTSAIVTGAAAPSAQAKPLFKSDHSWEDILGESILARYSVEGMGSLQSRAVRLGERTLRTPLRLLIDARFNPCFDSHDFAVMHMISATPNA
jgi:hypothetical protein